MPKLSFLQTALWAFAGLALAAGSTLALNAQTPQPATPAPVPAGAAARPQPARVRPKLAGFDIAPKAGRAPNQVGGASRGLGIELYAPKLGKAYTLTPTFHWRSEDPATEYTFRLAEISAAQSPLFAAKVTGDTFTYPATAPALLPGATYVWSVEPTLELLGGPASASILIVGGAERSTLAAALAGDGARPDPGAAQARTFTDARLWFDAIAAYTTLIARQPGRKELYRQRAEIYAQLPQTEALADADEARATP